MLKVFVDAPALEAAEAAGGAVIAEIVTHSEPRAE